MSQPPKYRFYPTLLDAYLNMANSDALYERYYGNSENPQVTAEEFHDLKYQNLIDSINRIDGITSEAAAKGTCLNEIVDLIIQGKPSGNKKVLVKTIRSVEDYMEAVGGHEPWLMPDEDVEKARELLAKIGRPFIYASHEGHSFCFDITLCKEIARYFDGCLSQFYTSAFLPTSKGGVILYGFIDYLKEKTIYDLKTTKSYSFGNYDKYMQRHAYPYCMRESKMMAEVQQFEFTSYALKGGTSAAPLITGVQNREVYNYDHRQSTEILTQTCERLIEFVEDNMEKIDKSKTKIFI